MKITKILNIGLDTTTRHKNKLTNAQVLARIKNALNNAYIDYYIKLADSTTEKTAIVYVWGNISNNLLAFLSMICKQDCIAVYDTKEKQGKLIGTHKHLWGSFELQYFLGLNIKTTFLNRGIK